MDTHKRRRLIFFGILLVISAALIAMASYTFVPPEIRGPYYLDKIYHFIGGFLAAWFAALYFDRDLWLLRRTKVIVLLVAGGAFIGVIWECLELASTLYSPTYFPLLAQYYGIGDLVDTVGDLAIDSLGAFIFALIYCRIFWHREIR